MTIAIVDDAVLIRQGLKKLIETSYPDATIVGEASNGAEGLALLKSNRVDVCIVDIRMPIMSGIEMVAQYRLKNRHTKFIVLSGYADFTYAKEMMGHGAIAYLLKPVDHQEFHEVLHTVRRNSIQRTPTVQDISSRASEFLRSLGHECTQARHLVLLTTTGGTLESEELEGHVCTILEESEHRSCILDRETMLLVAAADIDSESLIFPITKSVWKKYAVHVCAVVAKLEEFLNASDQEIRFLLESSFHCREEEVLTYRKPKPLEEFPLFFLMEEQMFLDLTLLNFHGVARRLTSLLRQLSIYRTPKTHCLFTMNRIYLTLRRGLDRRNIQPLLNILPDTEQLQALLKECERFMQFEQIIGEIIDQLTEFESIQQQEEHGLQKPAIRTILRYIGEHIHKNLSLNQIARVVRMNPSYFSLYFKKEMGENYISFITRVKIQKAKELLQDPNLKIYELAEMLGYKDTKYFCRKFKDIVGLTPTQYKEAIITRLDDQDEEG